MGEGRWTGRGRGSEKNERVMRWREQRRIRSREEGEDTEY